MLTRKLHDTPAREQYEFLSVERFWNPAPAVWKEYAVGVHPVPFWKRSVVTGLDVFCALPALRRLMVESDLVHLHFPLPLGLSLLIARTLVKRPLVVTVHGNADVYELPRAMEPLTRAVLKRADVTVSVSEDLGEYLRHQMGIRNVRVIPNGVDVDQFHPGERPRGPLTLFSISRLVPRKNIDVLIPQRSSTWPARERRCLSSSQALAPRRRRSAARGAAARHRPLCRVRRRGPQAHPPGRHRRVRPIVHTGRSVDRHARGACVRCALPRLRSSWRA